MDTLYVFKNKDSKSKADQGVDIASMVKSGRIARISGEELYVLGTESKIYYLVQGDSLLGMAFDYDDACKGFRIMAHQQYLDGIDIPYPIQIYTGKNLDIDYEPGSTFTLRHIRC